jgi:hypothetical protein
MSETAETKSKIKGPRTLSRDQIDKIAADLKQLAKTDAPAKATDTKETMLNVFAPIVNAALEKGWSEDEIIAKMMDHGLTKAQGKVAIVIAKTGKLPPKPAKKEKGETTGPQKPS